MKETLLFKAASAWVSLSRYRYSFTYGFRMKLYDLHLSFYPNDFPHLAGFQYLKDLNLPRYTPSKIIQKILEGTITQEQIEKGQQYEKLVKPRLLAITELENMLDNNFTLYSYMPRFYSFSTSIKADYLIASQIDTIRYIFLIRENKEKPISSYIACSIFTKDDRDYEQNQRSYVLLQKTKTRLSDGETQILFTKPGFDEHKSSISKPLLF